MRMKWTSIWLQVILPLFASASRLAVEPVTVKDITIQCHSSNIRVAITTEDNFNGMVYPKGLSKNSSCLSEYEHAGSKITYVLPLHSCNTMSADLFDGIVYYNTVVVQPHPKLVTSLGKGFHVRCKYETQKKNIDSDHKVGPLGTTPIAITTPLPTCTMKIYLGDSNGQVADHAKIGDHLTIVINIDHQDIYGMKVTNCLVRDGLNWAEQPLINNEGCPLDEEVMGPFQYSLNSTQAKVTFPAHKFPYTPSVYYQCNVKLCLKNSGGCDDVPPNCDNDGFNINKRKKRALAEIERSGNLRELIREDQDVKYLNVEVYSGLYVDEVNEPEESAQEQENVRPSTPDDDFCVSTRKFAIGIAIAGVLLMLAVLLLIACILHRRRRRKGTSAAGSSIYSGPYSNHAYSRD